MFGGDVVWEKLHLGHEARWCTPRAPGGGGWRLCVLCVLELMERQDVASVRKSYALSGVSGVLKYSPGALKELLQQDQQVSLRFIASLLGMLQSTEDTSTLEKVDQVLLQVLLELQSEPPFRFVLDQIQKQLCGPLNARGWPSTFNFIGRLLEAVPNITYVLVTEYVPLLDHLCSAPLSADEELKASIICVWIKLFGASAAAVPASIRDRVCVLLLQTLANASTTVLITNCIGLLWLLVQVAAAVSVLMSSASAPLMCEESQSSQSPEQQPPEHSPLPLILKKLLLSGDEMLQVSSAKCIASVLVHSPRQYSAPFIKADVPEFLFDRLAGTKSEALLWSVYTCLKLLTEDSLFFSQCHSVYGIESLVRSLKEALRLTNLEVSKRGLLLLTVILERQPREVRLFPSVPDFVGVCEALEAGVSSSCLLVATQAVKATCILLRKQHQSRPVQFKEITGMIESITKRFSELSLSLHIRHQNSVSETFMSSSIKSSICSPASRSHVFLLQALVCFQSACRLALECASEPGLKENAFTAPSKTQQNEDSLESLCRCMLRCCDSVWIPAVIKASQHGPNAQILQHFYSILSSQFFLLPSLMPVFARKLASSCFVRVALEHKSLLCTGNRNPNLNASCCEFLFNLSLCLYKESDCDRLDGFQSEAEEVENVLLHHLPALSCPLSDWPSLLRKAPGLQLCDYKGQRATQYCVMVLLHLAFQQGDRLLPDQTVFFSVVWLLRSVQEQGSCVLPHFVLRSALYLLSVTQDKSPSLEKTQLKCINKALSSCQTLSSVYIHHPPLLHFICRYSELERFRALVLELWLTRKASHPDLNSEDSREKQHGEEDDEPEITELLTLIEKYPAVTATLLEMVCTRETGLAQRALNVLEVLLSSQTHYKAELCTNLRPALLQALQKLSVEEVGHELGQGNTTQVRSLPLVLRLLCTTQTREPSSSWSKMDGVSFKLLYHVSNLAGKLKPDDTESTQLALRYMHRFLSLSAASRTDRVVSMLLSNTALMELLQTVITSSPSPASTALLCSSHLLLSSLITLQNVHSAKVHKSISWSLDKAVHRLVFQKRNTDSLLLVSYLTLLQALLDVDFISPVLCVVTAPCLVGPRPLGVEDGVLYPLGSKGAQFLSVALNELLLQKHEVLLGASVNCLSSLLGFLQRKSPTTALHIVCQPWCRFLVFCLLGSGQSCLLHPATLQLMTLLLMHRSTAVLWEPDLLKVMEAVEKVGVKELGQEAAEALRLLLTQIQRSTFHPPPSERDEQRVRNILESLSPQTADNIQCPSVEVQSHVSSANSVCL
ncbi:meiosis inhibitor protein 1 [Periophthalmus magnuspinnatus]|uniref:meiosis inhibitor protein 1 n=1 Tax=Periophthalmus magnuspinnatus TaxID=409849 RepID=UPI00243667E9|nr:meiosis inhibitor protein 1 [Periophthalmus magnuspinnatus]